jgi:hypothetical protein
MENFSLLPLFLKVSCKNFSSYGNRQPLRGGPGWRVQPICWLNGGRTWHSAHKGCMG